MGVLTDFVFSNSYKSDAKEAEDALRKKYRKFFLQRRSEWKALGLSSLFLSLNPVFVCATAHLLHENETIELAFKDRGGKGRDKEIFTSHRILVKDGKGVGSKRKNYLSIPYSSIQAFSIETSGAVFDGDCELMIYPSAAPPVSIAPVCKCGHFSDSAALQHEDRMVGRPWNLRLCRSCPTKYGQETESSRKCS